MTSLRGLLLGLFAAGLLLAGLIHPTQAAPGRPVELLVKLRGQPRPEIVDQLAARYGGVRRAEIAALGVQVLRFPAQAGEQALLARLRGDVAVDYAEPNGIVTASAVPNDPGFASQWGLEKTRADQGWDSEAGSLNTIIAVVDSGADPDHPDLQGKRVLGWNYDATSADYNTAITTDDNGHGTHVAGIAAAATNNGVGVAGMCAGCGFMAVKVLDADGNGTYDAVARGIIFAADNGARIINLSLSGALPSQTLEDAVTYAANKGALLVAAAGNDGGSGANYPAAYAQVMAVAATDSSDQRASFSSYNTYMSVAAPGVSIYSTSWSVGAGSDYAYLSGTSMSTAFVSGLAGLLFSQESARDRVAVRSIIEQSAVDIGATGWDAETGYGRIDVVRALGGTIAGSVTDAATGGSLASAQVAALRNGATIATATTDAGGAYRLASMPDGDYDLRVTLAGYTPQTRAGVVVAAGQTTAADFRLARTGAIEGNVLARGKAVAGAKIEARRDGQVVGSATSDADGNYRIGDLDAGTYTVTAMATGYRSQTQTGIAVRSGETTRGVNFVLKK